MDVKTSNFEAGVANGSIRYIPDEVYTAFVEQVKGQSVLFGENVKRPLKYYSLLQLFAKYNFVPVEWYKKYLSFVEKTRLLREDVDEKEEN